MNFNSFGVEEEVLKIAAEEELWLFLFSKHIGNNFFLVSFKRQKFWKRVHQRTKSEELVSGDFELVFRSWRSFFEDDLRVYGRSRFIKKKSDWKGNLLRQ